MMLDALMPLLWCIPPGLLMVRYCEPFGDGNVGSDDKPGPQA